MPQLEVTAAPLNLEIETNGRGDFWVFRPTNAIERGHNTANEEEGFHEGKVKPVPK